MLPFISIGIAAGLFLGLLSIATVGKLYHLLCCKKKIVSSDRHRPDDLQLKQETKSAYDAASVGWLSCWPKASVNTNNNNASGGQGQDCDDDVELGLGMGMRMKSFVEEGVEAELMRVHNLCGPPRFLFTIVEETPEDLVSEDGNFKCKTTSTRLIDLMRASDASFELSPIASPAKKKPHSPLFYSSGFVNNPLFECSAEAELNRLISSPPPKFKFLRDAEEKLLKKLEAERQQQ